MSRILSAIAISDSLISVEFDGTVDNETLRSPGLFSLFTNDGQRVPLTSSAFDGSRVVLSYSYRTNSSNATLTHELLGPYASVRVSSSLFPLAESFVCRRNVIDSSSYFVSTQITGQWDLDGCYSAAPQVCVVRSATRIANTSLVEVVLLSDDETDLPRCLIFINYTSTYTLTKNFTAISLSRCELTEQLRGPSNLLSDFPLWISFIVLFAFVFPLLYLAIIALGVYLRKTDHTSQ